MSDRYDNTFGPAPYGLVLDKEKSEEQGRVVQKIHPNYIDSELPYEGELNRPSRRRRTEKCKQLGITRKRLRKLLKRDR